MTWVKINDQTFAKEASPDPVDTKTREEFQNELEQIQEILNMPEPSDTELIELGKAHHPFYIQNSVDLQKRVDEIDEILSL